MYKLRVQERVRLSVYRLCVYLSVSEVTPNPEHACSYRGHGEKQPASKRETCDLKA
jgi:hypothetical protein